MTGHAIMADESVCLDSPTSGNGDPDPGMKQLRLCKTYNHQRIMLQVAFAIRDFDYSHRNLVEPNPLLM
jgi:hypothetical protein